MLFVEFVNNIPENIGWCVVGFLTCATFIFGYYLCKTILSMVKERKEDKMNENID